MKLSQNRAEPANRDDGLKAHPKPTGGGRTLAIAMMRVSGRTMFLVENFLTRSPNLDTKPLQHARRNPIALQQQAEENVFGADVSLLHCFGFPGGESQGSLRSRSVRGVADDDLVRSGANLPLDFRTDRLEIQAEFLQNIHGAALAAFEQSQEQVFGANKMVMEKPGLLLGKLQNLFRILTVRENG